MDCQSAMQLGSGGDAGATQEWLYAGGGQPPEQQQVVDGAFLMELLDDAPLAEQPPEDVDRLSRVMRSLEVEIGCGGPPVAPADGGSTAEHVPSDVDGGLDDMLSDLDSSPGQCMFAEAPPPFEYWAEVPPAVGHDMGGWYVDCDGEVVGGYEFREQCYYGYGESLAVEQVYNLLWE